MHTLYKKNQRSQIMVLHILNKVNKEYFVDQTYKTVYSEETIL